jgi:mycothiol synthase
MYLACDEADGSHRAGTLAEVEREFADPDTDFAHDSLLALTADGEVAAMAAVYLLPSAATKVVAFLWGGVHPRHRRRGLGRFLLSWQEARARQKMATRCEPLPRLLRVHCYDNEHDRIALFCRLGFEPYRYFYQMRRDLSQPIPEPVLPAGLRLVNWSPAYDRATLEAFNEAFADHWGSQPQTAEQWRLFMVGRDSFRPDLSFLVLDGEEVAGFALNFLSPEENERQGLREAWVGDLGVRRPWRKQGVATALLCLSMRAFRAVGMDYAALGVDTENPTGALRLYERLGFVPVRRSIAFGKLITP